MYCISNWTTLNVFYLPSNFLERFFIWLDKYFNTLNEIHSNVIFVGNNFLKNRFHVSMQKQLSPHVVEDLTFFMLYSCIQCKVILHLHELSHSGDKGLICSETSTECDPVHYVTFTDFWRVVHYTKPTHS